MHDRCRRAFIALVGGAAAWPLVVHAQQPAMPVVGFLNAGSPAERMNLVAAPPSFTRSRLHRKPECVHRIPLGRSQYDRLAALAADLVRSRVAIIATPGTPAALAAKAATTTIPIVFSSGSDPVKLGLVASLSRPGANVTGMSFLTSLLVTKQFDLLRELVDRI
jgi:putative ABC transport system substrate-binding protein